MCELQRQTALRLVIISFSLLKKSIIIVKHGVLWNDSGNSGCSTQIWCVPPSGHWWDSICDDGMWCKCNFLCPGHIFIYMQQTTADHTKTSKVKYV